MNCVDHFVYATFRSAMGLTLGWLSVYNGVCLNTFACHYFCCPSGSGSHLFDSLGNWLLYLVVSLLLISSFR